MNTECPDGSPRTDESSNKWHSPTSPALNRRGRSRSALNRADLETANPAQWSFHALRVQRPLRVKSRPFSTAVRMSAFGGKADVNHCVGECLLIAKSGHSGDALWSVV